MAASVRLSRLEFLVMDTPWNNGGASIREMLQGLPERKRPTYSTVQTMVYRLEAKGALNRIRLSGNFHVFEPAITRETAQKRVIDDLLSILAGQSRPIVARLIATGKLTMEDVGLQKRL